MMTERRETGNLKSRESVAKAREEVLESVRGKCINSALVNGIITAYQIALYRTLGAAANAMSQMLISELGDSLLEYVDKILNTKDHEDPLKSVLDAFQELGIAKDVTLEQPDENTWKFVIKDSVFKPTHSMLKQRGITSFTLSPEALLIAAIVRKGLREHGRGNERVKVEAMIEDSILVVTVKKIRALR
ncbi:hypothetical protein IPA_00045 [Ignicoccus pacificus DSM 13166]|uniref:Uncharacterized protein n=1 Tax=Ignicoccus pacificus DSM 13166 TaxID=940294 RepID=A0A977PK62_9CREN|nr:hypothetical protein IPA_00045 [Ignicoccus pacificus DSM 13166]